jgi:translocation protein SEC72
MTDSFLSLPLQYNEKTKSVVCCHHLVPKCTTCGLDFQALNSTYRAFNALDTPAPPPPTKQPHPARSAQIAKLRDSGDSSTKLHKYADAVRYYSLAIDMTLARPAWEAASVCRDETVMLLCSRSAARFAMKEYIESLGDAEAVVKLKSSWPKGHFRKCKALQAMGRLEEAKKAVELGLMSDPNDNECNLALKEVNKALQART